MPISLTEPAAARIKRHLSGGEDKRLRFGVRKTGCSGYAYELDFIDEPQPSDHVFDSRGIQIVVDNSSMRFVDGTTIDLRRDELGETFIFVNPNASAECGCGESFTVH